MPHYEKHTLQLVLEHTIEPYHLIAYQNKQKDENLSVVWNKLIKKSEADYICLLNTDVEVEPSWLNKLIEVFDKEKNIGIVGPTTNACGVSVQKIKEEERSDTYKIVDSNTLSGFCMVFPKKLWEEIGGFHEGYELYGEDSEFCHKAKELGYRLVVRKDVFIYHYKGQSAIKARIEGKDTFRIAAESGRLFKNRCILKRK